MQGASRAVLIGVGRYEKPGMAALKAPVSDVERLSLLLGRGNFDVLSLTDAAASKAAFETAARRLLRESRPSHCVLFYYSGHGVRDAADNLWLTTGAFDPEGDPYEAGVTAAQIRQWGREGNAGQVVLIFDCCFAGAAGRAAGAVANQDDFAARQAGRGTHVLMASDRNRVALTGDEVPPDGRASHFTDLLIRGLEGDAAPGADSISIAQLSFFLLQHGEAQLGHRPVVSIEEGQGDFPLVPVPDPGRTLIPRAVRDAARSQRMVERVGAVSLLGATLAEPPSERHAEAARQMLTELRDAADSDDKVRHAARHALSEALHSSEALERALAASRQERDAALVEGARQAARASEAEERTARQAADHDRELRELRDAIQRQREEQRRIMLDKEHELALLDRQRAELATELSEARLRGRELRAQVEEAEREIERLSNAPGTPDQEVARLTAERDYLRSQLVEARAATGRLTTEIEELQKRLDDTGGLLEERTQAASTAADALAAEQARAASLERDLGKLREEADRHVRERETGIAGLRGDLLQERSRAASLVAELEKLKEANAALRAVRDRLDGQIAQSGERVTAAETTLAAQKERSEKAAAAQAATIARLQRDLESARSGRPDRRRVLAVALAIAAIVGVVFYTVLRDARGLRASLEATRGALGNAEASLAGERERADVAVREAAALRQKLESVPAAPAPSAPSVPTLIPPEILRRLPTPASVTDCPECPRLVQADAAPGVLIGVVPVTVGQFRAYLRASNAPIPAGCRTPGLPASREADASLSWNAPGFTQTDDHPVVCVSYADVAGYLTWLRTRTGRDYTLLSATIRAALLTARYPTRDALPSDNWCAIGNVRDLTLRQALESPAGRVAAPELGWRPEASANCTDGSAFTSPVGRFPAIGGISDLLGNVMEWTSDQNPISRQPVTVGVSWASPLDLPNNQVLWRGDYNPNLRFNFIGFRVSRNR